MRNESRRAKSLLLAILVATAAGRARAEGGVGAVFPALSSALPAEAPSSVFSAKLGEGPDADAELLVSGSWSSTLIASLDLQAQPGSSLALSSAQPLLFTQEPDIALSFLLYKKIFVEARVSQDVAQAKYAAGYRGGEGELLREARIGNDGINFPSLPYLSFGDGSYRSFGASALIGTDTFAGKAMVRYDQASRVVRRFVGSTEVTESVLAPNSFVTGKYFLTLNAPGTNLAVYVQSSSGSLSGNDGNKYRKLDSSEFSYSGVTGVVSLSAAAATRVLAYYPGSGSDVTLAGVGPCDLLYEPPSTDHVSPNLDPKLQILGRYATTATASTAEVFVRNPSSGLRATDYEASINEAGYVEVTKPGMDAVGARAAGTPDVYRRPFESADMSWIYRTDFASDTKKIGIAPVFTRDVVVRTFASSATMTIDKDFVAGSIEVTRDGVPDYAFTVDADSGIITFASPPAPAEEIVISYLKESSERKSGIIVGALGGFWDLGSGRRAWAALGAAWSLPGSSYSSGADSSPGSISLTGGEKDTKGAFKSDFAMAARYSRDDSTGIYRIEGMESTSDYASSFRPIPMTLTGYIDSEIVESDLHSNFPSLIDSFHKDGSAQKALHIIAGSGADPTAAYYKIEDAPAYPSYKTFAFYAKLPASISAKLTITLDDGNSVPTTSMEVAVPADVATSTWKRYILHYGKGDSNVYVQDNEGSSEKLIPGATSVSPSITSTGSRLVIAVSGLLAGDEAWVDEIVLEDSVGRSALLFQGSASYDNPEFMLGKEESPILSGFRASAFAQGAVDQDPYASGGGSLHGNLGFVGLGINARAAVAKDSTTFSGGHSIELPSSSFPVQVKDGFDYNPASGAFGRTDAISLKGGNIASLSAKQSSAWTPGASFLDSGIFVQDWDGSLVLGPSIASFGLTAQNRALPTKAPAAAGSGNDYAAAWIGAFAYALPAFEGDSELREAKATLSVKGGPNEYLSASLGEATTPKVSSAGLRGDEAAIRLALPFPAFGLKLEPYYSRTWKDQRNESEGSMVGDAGAALGDIARLPILYGGAPFAEFFSSRTASSFAEQSAPSGAPLPAASYLPEAGLRMARESGSGWLDLVAPSALSFSYGRKLARAEDTVTDASVWTTSAKYSAINVFGAMGTHPLGLPFDSDEYLTTLQADLTAPRDGSASSYDLLYHGLATLYAGRDDRLDAESKFSIAELPSSMNWTGSLSLALSRRLARHWLLDLYSLAVKPSAPAAEGTGEGQGKQASVASLYLRDLKTRESVMRSTWTLMGGLAGVRSDAAAYQPGWSLAESYEAKLTVPERLTIRVTGTLDQSLEASTQVLSLGFILSLNAVISF
jgi:hypothetical protein